MAHRAEKVAYFGVCSHLLKRSFPLWSDGMFLRCQLAGTGCLEVLPAFCVLIDVISHLEDGVALSLSSPSRPSLSPHTTVSYVSGCSVLCPRLPLCLACDSGSADLFRRPFRCSSTSFSLENVICRFFSYYFEFFLLLFRFSALGVCFVSTSPHHTPAFDLVLPHH